MVDNRLVVIDGSLVKEEEKDVGVVAFSVYRSYWYAVGTFLAPLILLSLFLMQGVCAHGVHMHITWYTHSIHRIYTWYKHGIHRVYTGYTHGIHRV